MRALVAAALLVSVLCTAAARAAVAVGDPAPPLEAKEFINIEPFKMEDLKDSVVVLEIFRTNEKMSNEQAANLDGLVEQYAGRGVVVVAVTNEERKLVDAFVAAHKPKHAIVIESGDIARTWGLVKGFPTAYVIGPDGKIAWTGNWAEKAKEKIDLLLRKAKRSPRLPERFAATRDLAEAGKYAEAWHALDAEMKAGTVTDAEKPHVQRMLAWIDAQLQKRLVDAADMSSKGQLYEAAVEFEQIAKEYADLEVGTKATAALKQIMDNPAAKREVDAGKQLAIAIESAKSASPAKAIALYKAIVSKWKDTQAATKASGLIAEIEKSKQPPK